MRRKSKEKTLDEILTYGYMPERFTTGYLELVRLGLKVDPNAQVFDNQSGSVKKKYRTPDGGIKDEAALRFKAWVDRQLRAIGRDVQAYLNARDSKGPSPIGMSPALRREVARELERKTELQCRNVPDCGKYISWQWRFCAWCGKEVARETVQDEGNGGNREQGRSSSESKAPANCIQLFPGGTRADVAGADGAAARQDVPGTDGTAGCLGSDSD